MHKDRVDPNTAPTLLERWFLRETGRAHGKLQAFLRVVLSQYVTNGLTVSLGLVLIMLVMFQIAGLAAAATAAVGVIITTLPDVPAPRKRKIMQMLPAPLMGMPLFALVQLVRSDELLLGVVLVSGTFLALMMMAWGKRGGPLCFSLLFSMLFSMAAPTASAIEQIVLHAGWFSLGAALYLLWAVLTTHLLNQRYRTQLLAECLSNFALILRTQAGRFAQQPDHDALLAKMLQQQASLADRLQNTRDLVLESPTTAKRLRLAAMLIALLEARDHQLACNLDLDFLLDQDARASTLPALQQALDTIAKRLDTLSMSLLLGRSGHAIAAIDDLRAQLDGLLPLRPAPAKALAPDPLKMHLPDTGALLQNMADRIGYISDEVRKMAALARRDVKPELADVRAQWQLFVSTTTWSWTPLLGQLAWRAPTLRYALRATLAVGSGYLISLHLPWVAHDYWILITIVAVMRGDLAQTVQRRNARVLGTVVGCGLVMGVLALHPGARAIFLIVALSMGLAHAFALRRYFYTAIAATLAGLLQAHLLLVGVQPSFAIGERLADTLLGAFIAWIFSYVLPTWERNQIPALVRRSVEAQLSHARLALALRDEAQISDLPWRLARRDAYNSLSELTLATQRSLAEPQQVRPAVEPLEALQARSYQLLAQLTAVKSMVLLRRAQLDMTLAATALAQAAECIALELRDVSTSSKKTSPTSAAPQASSSIAPAVAGQPFQPKPDLLMADDLTPWLLRRLTLACVMATELRLAAARALG